MRSAVVIAVTILVVTLARAALDGWTSGGRQLNWQRSLGFAAVFGLLWFCAYFAFGLLAFRAEAPAAEILDHVSSDGAAEEKLSGFVAMEYYGLILNRTFVVFIALDGLYGWKVVGAVPAGMPRYFEPYAKMLDDTELMHDLAAVRKLAELKGGFFIPRSEISSVEVVPKQKAGMAGIPHTGRIRVHFASGGKREFILLGTVDATPIARSISS